MSTPVCRYWVCSEAGPSTYYWAKLLTLSYAGLRFPNRKCAPWRLSLQPLSTVEGASKRFAERPTAARAYAARGDRVLLLIDFMVDEDIVQRWSLHALLSLACLLQQTLDRFTRDMPDTSRAEGRPEACNVPVSCQNYNYAHSHGNAAYWSDRHAYETL